LKFRRFTIFVLFSYKKKIVILDTLKIAFDSLDDHWNDEKNREFS